MAKRNAPKATRRQTPSNPRVVGGVEPSGDDERLIAMARKLLSGRGDGPMPTREWLATEEGDGARRAYQTSPVGRADTADFWQAFERANPKAAKLARFYETPEGRDLIEERGRAIERVTALYTALKYDPEDARALAVLERLDIHDVIELESWLKSAADRARARPGRRAAVPKRELDPATAMIVLALDEARRSAQSGKTGRTLAKHADLYARDRKATPLDMGTAGYTVNGSGAKAIPAPTYSALQKRLPVYFSKANIPDHDEQAAGKGAYLQEAVKRKLRGIVDRYLEKRERERL